jgi:hypothetical protein
METAQPLHRRLCRWVRNQIVQPVPEREGVRILTAASNRAPKGSGKPAERRVQKAAGQLMPESASSVRGETSPPATPSGTAAKTPASAGTKASSYPPFSKRCPSHCPRPTGESRRVGAPRRRRRLTVSGAMPSGSAAHNSPAAFPRFVRRRWLPQLVRNRAAR